VRVLEVHPSGGLRWELLNPITEADIAQALKSMGKKAAGPDGMRAKQLAEIPGAHVAGLLNVILATGYLPKSLNTARTTLIPKVEVPANPSQFRSISLTNMVIRVPHNIPMDRWTKVATFDRFQFGFMKRDGTCDSILLLHQVLRVSREMTKAICLAVLDMSKAFDSVSRETVLRAVESYGAPRPLLEYLRNYHSSATTRFGSVPANINRGVRQGDPLSPILFNMVMKEIIDKTGRQLGFNLKGTMVDSLAFANDLVLICDSPIVLQKEK